MKRTEEIVREKELLQGLSEGRYQLGVFSNLADGRNLIQIPFFNEQLYAIIPEKHPLSQKKNGLYLSDIDGEDIIPFPLKGYWNDLLERKLPNSEKYYQASIKSFDAIVRASTIISFTSDAMLRDMKEHVNLPILDREATITYHLACNKMDSGLFRPLFNLLKPSTH